MACYYFMTKAYKFSLGLKKLPFYNDSLDVGFNHSA